MGKCRSIIWIPYHYKDDTLIAFHAKHADINDPAGIVVHANDTDTAVILLFSRA